MDLVEPGMVTSRVSFVSEKELGGQNYSFLNFLFVPTRDAEAGTRAAQQRAGTWAFAVRLPLGLSPALVLRQLLKEQLRSSAGSSSTAPHPPSLGRELGSTYRRTVSFLRILLSL